MKLKKNRCSVQGIYVILLDFYRLIYYSGHTQNSQKQFLLL